ncbi:MAG: glycine zipper 2TM domain-containing protein [Candidatus Omnitrophica bacterium]|nr:glycine zipper 2TM domain-containing protein [Candidatus Omnitrophota bacterium]
MSGTAGLKQVVLVIAVFTAFSSATAAYARGGDDHDRYSDRYSDRHSRYRDQPRFGMRINLISNAYTPVIVQGSRYYYYDGLFYTPMGGSYVLITPPIGAIVPVIPREYRPVLINGSIYYTDNGIYYVYVGRGYQVVPPPNAYVVQEPVYMRQTTQVYAETPNQTKVGEGIGLGAVIGALTGGIIGHQMKGSHELGGALLGGAAGAAVGGILGAQIPNENASMPVTAVPSAPVAVQPPVAVAAPQPVAEESFPINIPNPQGGYVTVTIKRSGTGFVGPQGEYYAEFPKVAQLQAMYVK